MGGFAEVVANEVTVLVNGAELGSAIDTSTAQSEFEAAQQAAADLEGSEPSPEKVKAQQALARARARLQASKGA